MRIRRPELRHSITRRRAADQRHNRNAHRRSDRGHSATPWLTLAATLPGLAALVALLFNWVSVSQTRTQLQIAEQAQFTTRFNEAVTHLGSSSTDVRFGGIYALERIMQDSPRDQPRVIAVLSAYMRTHAPVPVHGFPKLKENEAPPPIATDVTAVTEVLAERPLGQDSRTKINWSNTDLRGLKLFTRRADKESGGDPSAPRYVPFAFTDLSGADLQMAKLNGVDLHGANADRANLAGANLTDVKLNSAYMFHADLSDVWSTGTSLRNAVLFGANLSGAQLYGVDLSGSILDQANLAGAFVSLDDHLDQPDSNRETPTNLTGADLRFAVLVSANLIGANLTGADLTGANLDRASLGAGEGSPAVNLTRANLTDAHLGGADLTGANLTGANLKGADLTGANLTGANLKGAHLKGAITDKAIGLPSP